MNKLLIGFSTGFLWHTYPRASKDVIRLCRDIGCNAIGVHCKLERFDLLEQLTKDDFDGFEFIAFHLPCEVNEENKKWLDKVEAVHKKIGFDNITVHPNLKNDWKVFDQYNLPFSIENMDERKEIGKSLESMKEIMSGNNYEVTIDINHCFVNDNTLKLADDLWSEFKDRVSHFHLSGIEERHDPLFLTNQTQLIDFVKDKNKPIIIESVCKNEEDAKREFDFILKHLN